MGFWRKTGKILGLFVDVRVDKWVGAQYIKASSSKTLHILKSSFTPEAANLPETFEEALERLNLTEADILERQKELKRLRLIFCFLTLMMFTYTISIFLKHSIGGTLIGISLTTFLLAYIFRFDFYLFSIERKKLGCQLQDWVQGRLYRK